MFILRDLLPPLQQAFSNTPQGQKRQFWFVYTLLAVVIPFISSITSNLLRALQALFGLEIKCQRFYTFMASSTLPWEQLWKTLWGLIPDSATLGRILVALDDSISPKSGRNIFACGHFHDHAAKGKQTSYPWSQCIVDYCGPTMTVVNPDTGECRQAQVFVAVLGASNYTFACASWTQGQADWLNAHVKAFAFFEGVPEVIVPDYVPRNIIHNH